MKPTLTRRTSAVIGAALLIPLLVYAAASWFSRLLADDYCYAVNLHLYGFPGIIPYYYDHWFGRITQIVGAALGSAAGVPFAAVFPVALLVIWLIGLLWACAEALRVRLFSASAGILALLILYATLAGSPQIFHSLYWISGVFPYTVPLVAITYGAAIIFRASRTGTASLWAIFTCILLALIAVWSSEPAAVALVGGLALAAGIFMLYRSDSRHRAVLILFVATLIAAVVGLIILVAAPGNTLRQSLFEGTHAPAELLIQSLSYGAASLVVAAMLSPSTLPLALLLSAIIGCTLPSRDIPRRTLRIAAGLTALVAFGLLVLVNVPGIYATSLPPPARAGIINQFIIVAACVVIGVLLGMTARRTLRYASYRVIAALIAVLLVAGPLLTAWNTAALFPRLMTHAQEWDIRDATLRAAAAGGQRRVEVAPFSVDVASLTGLDTVGADADAFPNECVAQYYGLESVTAFVTPN